MATKSDHDEVIGFLEGQGVLENAWLIWAVPSALDVPERCGSLLVCRLRDDVAGVAHILPVTEGPSGRRPDHDYHAQMDAADQKAAESLLAELPEGQSVLFRPVFRPLIQECLGSLPGCTRSDGDLYYTVTLDRFRPVPSDEVVELTAADAGLFEGCENQPAWESMRDNSP